MSTAGKITTYSRQFDCSELAFRHLIQRIKNRYPRGWVSPSGVTVTSKLVVERFIDGFPTTVRVDAQSSDQTSVRGRATLRVKPQEQGIIVGVEDGCRSSPSWTDRVYAQTPMGSPVEEFLDFLTEQAANPIAPLEPGLDMNSIHRRHLLQEAGTIHSEAFEGELRDLQQLMMRLKNRYRSGWPPSGSQRVAFGGTIVDRGFPLDEYWVELAACAGRDVRPKPCAMVQAQIAPEGVVIDFQDAVDARGRTVDVQPLGCIFERFCDLVVGELRSQVVPMAPSEQLGSRPDFVLSNSDRIIHRVPIGDNLPFSSNILLSVLNGWVKEWKSSEGTRLEVGKVRTGLHPFLEVFWLQPAVPLGEETHRCACIAVDRFRDVLNFLDGIDPRDRDRERVDPIGLPFEEFFASFLKETRSRPIQLYHKRVEGTRKKAGLVQTAPFRGSLEDFRALMDSLLHDSPDGWLASDGTRLQLRPGPKSADGGRRESYYLVEAVAGAERRPTGCCATVKGEEEQGMTFVTFQDCHRWQSTIAEAEQLRPIGKPFEEFRTAIIEEIEFRCLAQSGESGLEGEREVACDSDPAKEETHTASKADAEDSAARKDLQDDSLVDQTGTKFDAAVDESPSSVASGEVSPPGLAHSGRTDPRYIFRQLGDDWEIAYEGERFLLNDLKGVALIHELLSRPRRYYRPLELEDAVEGVSPDSPVGPDKWEEEEITPDGAQSQPVLDEKTKKTCKARLKEIAELLPDAEIRRDEPEVRALEKEREKIEAYLSRSTGLGGKPRSFTDEGEKARQRVQKSIRRAIERIKVHSPNLAEHLAEQIKTGYECVYKVNPHHEMPWDL